MHIHVPQEGYDKITLKGGLCVFGAWCILLIIGAQLSWGNMSTYIASYFHSIGQPVTMEQFYVVQPIIVVTATVLFPVGMHLSKLYNTRM